MKHKIAFGLYFLTALVLLGFGTRYFFAGQLMPYHAETLAVARDGLPDVYQLVIITLYRATGAGMLVTGAALMVILFLPYRQGQAWARWALSGLGLIYGVMSAFLTLAYQAGTTADVPWQGPVASVVVIVIAHILSAGLGEQAGDA